MKKNFNETLLRELRKAGEVTRAVSLLLPRERYIITKHYGLDGNDPISLQSLARDFDISRERARQIETVALNKVLFSLKKKELCIIVRSDK